MILKIINRFIFFLVFISGACRGDMNNQDLAAYISKPENKLKIETQSGNYRIWVQYMPASLLFDKKENKNKKRLLQSMIP